MSTRTKKILSKIEQMQQEAKERAAELYHVPDVFDNKTAVRTDYCMVCDEDTKQVVEEDEGHHFPGDESNPQFFGRHTPIEVTYWNCCKCDGHVQDISRNDLYNR